MARGAGAQSQQWGIVSVFAATKLVVAGALVALFAGIVVAGVPPTSPERQTAPAAAATTRPSASGSPTPSTYPDASVTSDSSATPVYEATGRLVVEPGPDPSAQDLEVARVRAVAYASQAVSTPVLEAVIQELGLSESVDHIRGRITAEAVEDTFGVTITARDGDPVATQALAIALGDGLRQNVRAALLTPQVKKADSAIAAAQRQQRILQARFDQLSRKSRPNQLERNEMILLAGQLSAIRQDMLDLRSSSSAGVRYLLEWAERPGAGVPFDSAGPPAASPRIDIVVADRPIGRGTAIEADMLTVIPVPANATNAMVLTDVRSAVGKVAAIDILANQPIAPNMLTSE